MAVFQIQLTQQQEKEVLLFLKEMGVTVKKLADDPFTKKINRAIKELNDVADGKIEARSFEDLLNEI